MTRPVDATKAGAADIPEDQQRIRSRCVHPAGTFVGFDADELEQSIPARFERQVRRYPERLAVKTASQRLSYAELDRAANRVARAILTRRGEGNEPVAVLLDQGAAAAAAMLGVLKAGRSARPPFVAPRTPVERALGQIWADVLRLDRVGVHEGFLDLGGHSLLAAQIASRVHGAFRVMVPLPALLEASTVAEMAVVIAEHMAGEGRSVD